MFGIGENYEMLWKAIIRPPRATYSAFEVGIHYFNSGPQIFRKNGIKIKRT